MMRGRDSFAMVGRMSLEFATDVAHQIGGVTETAVRESVREIKEAVGPLRKSYFAVSIIALIC